MSILKSEYMNLHEVLSDLNLTQPPVTVSTSKYRKEDNDAVCAFRKNQHDSTGEILRSALEQCEMMRNTHEIRMRKSL